MLPPEWTRQRLHKFDASRHGTHMVVSHIDGTRVRSRSAFHGRAANRAPTTRAVAAKVLRGVRRGGQSTEAAFSKTGEQGGGWRWRACGLEAAASAGVESRQGWRRDYEFSSSEIHLMALLFFKRITTHGPAGPILSQPYDQLILVMFHEGPVEVTTDNGIARPQAMGALAWGVLLRSFVHCSNFSTI